MGVPGLIAVITKIDTSSEKRVRQVAQRAAEECRRLGYPEVPTVAVSSQTGQGIDELKGTAVNVIDVIQDIVDEVIHRVFGHGYV